MIAIQATRTGGPEVLLPATVAEPQLDAKSLLVAALIQRGCRDPRRRGDGNGARGRRRRQQPSRRRPRRLDRRQGDLRRSGAGAGSHDRQAARRPADNAGFILAQGLAAPHLAHDIVGIGPGVVALVHAAAGGVGSLLTRMLKLRGARVVATVSSAAKADAARDSGADEVIVDAGAELAPRGRDATQGAGVHVVFDGTGRDTFAASLACLRVRGMLVLYGTSSGPLDPVDPTRAGSVSLIRPGALHRDARRIPVARRCALRLARRRQHRVEGRRALRIGRRRSCAPRCAGAPQQHRQADPRRDMSRVETMTSRLCDAAGRIPA